MTGKELIDWIIEHKAENAIVKVVYRDDGGLYYGTDDDIHPFIVEKNVKISKYIPEKDYERLIL